MTGNWLGSHGADGLSTYAAVGCATMGASLMEIDYVMPAMPRLIRRPQARRDARPLWMTLRAVDPELARNTPLIAADHRWLISCNDLLATELDELSGIGRAFRQPHPLVTDVLAHLSKPDPSAAVPSE